MVELGHRSDREITLCACIWVLAALGSPERGILSHLISVTPIPLSVSAIRSGVSYQPTVFSVGTILSGT